MNITFQIDEKSVEVLFTGLKKDLEKVAGNTVVALGNSLVESAQNTTKFRHGANFNSGIKFTKETELSGSVTSQSFSDKGVEYSNFLEYGNLPVDGKKMTFQIDGQWITTYKRAAIGAEHLGFFTDAINATEEKVQDVFDEEFQKLFK